MKEPRKFCAITLLLSVWAGCAATTSLRTALDSGLPVARRLDDEDAQALIARVENLKGAQFDEFKKIAKDIVYQVESSDECAAQHADKPMRVCVSKAPGLVKVVFTSPSETSTLDLTNLGLDSTEIELEEYLESFAKQFGEQAVTPQQKLEAVNKALKDLGKQVGGLAISLSGALEEGKPLHVTVGQYQPADGFDVEWDGKSESLAFRTNYFENVLTLTMSDRAVIAAEVKKVSEDVVRHLERTKRFSLEAAVEDHNAEKTLSCGDLLSLDDGKTLFKALVAKTNAKPAADKGDGSKQVVKLTLNGQAVAISCSPVTQDDFELLVVRVDLGKNFLGVVQPFFSKSLYDLRPVAESFFEDVGTQMVQLFGTPKSSQA